MTNKDIKYGKISNAIELGELARAHRKSRALPLETVSGLANLGTRFLSEFERGKETAEIGKALKALQTIGLEVIIQPRGTPITTDFDVPIAYESTGDIARKKDEDK